MPALGLDERRNTLALSVPIRRAAVALREAVDVDQPFVVAQLDDPPEHADGVVPVGKIEDSDGHALIAAHVPQAQPLDVHVDEDAALVPLVPGRGRVRSAISAHSGDDRSMQALQKLNDLGGKRCARQDASLR